MFITLFLKECRETLKSITYYIFLICTIMFFVTQMGELRGITKPTEDKGNYGFKYSYDENVIMNSTLKNLAFEVNKNVYGTYPIGFYKEVRLDKDEENKIYGILEKITETNIDELKNKIKNYSIKEDGTSEIKSKVKYKEFSKYMGEVDDILGGGSSYNPKYLYRNAEVPMTYEDAVEEYESIINNDKVSRAYARLFCDYMGIVLAILPTFLVVTRALKDKRSKAEEVIFSKKASSTVIILSRYISMVVMILIPLILISITLTLQSIYCASTNGVTADYFAFIKGIFGWLLPTILFTLSLGFLLSEIISAPIVILIQGGVWLLNIFAGGFNLVGKVGINLIPRFNAIGCYDVYVKVFYELIINRIIYSVASILIMIITIFLYDKKREGKLIRNGKISKDSKSKFKI